MFLLKICPILTDTLSTPHLLLCPPPPPLLPLPLLQVDPRHLNLIADYMTFEGGYRPLNRMGITSNASPLLKMSFETSMNFMTDACLHGENDDLKSPSSRIVMGQVVNGGTGSIQLLQPVVEHVTPKLPDMF